MSSSSSSTTDAKKRARFSVPVFVGGLQYKWFRRNQDETIRTVSEFFKREAHFDGEVTVNLRKASAEVVFAGYGPWPYQAALRALELKEIKEHNACNRQMLERGASSVERSADESSSSSSSSFGSCSVYAKLDDCIARCQTQRAWAYDLKPDPKSPKSAPKRYVRATLDEFTQAYARLAGKERHAYEVIDDSKPCFSYFDLEFSRNVAPDDEENERDGVAIARRITDAAVAVIRRLCGAAGRDVEIDAVFLDSSRPHKFSQHVILRSYVVAPPFGRRILAPLQGSEAAGKVARLTVKELRDDFDKSVVDTLVYTKNRCFRIEGSSKLGSAVPLRVHSCLRYSTADAVVEIEPPKAGDLSRTVVVPELEHPNVHVLRFKDDLIHCPPSQPSEKGMMNLVPKSVNPPSVSTKDATISPNGVDAASSTITPPAEPRREDGTGISWLKSWNGATATPLLDMIDVKHEFVRAKQTGKRNPPQPFSKLAEWAVSLAQRLLRPTKPVTIYAWRYVRAEFPAEQYLHLTIFGTRYCHARGRQHQSNNVIITIDPATGAAWQRCWDSADCCECAKTADGANVRLYAKHLFEERAPPEVLPRPLDLYAFEIGGGLYRRRSDGADQNAAAVATTEKTSMDVDGRTDEKEKRSPQTAQQTPQPTSSEGAAEDGNEMTTSAQTENPEVASETTLGALNLLASVSSRSEGGVENTNTFPPLENWICMAETVTL